MGTTALTAQAIGADESREATAVFLRAASIGGTIGLIFILASWPLGNLTMNLLGGSMEAESSGAGLLRRANLRCAVLVDHVSDHITCLDCRKRS